MILPRKRLAFTAVLPELDLFRVPPARAGSEASSRLRLRSDGF